MVIDMGSHHSAADDAGDYHFWGSGDRAGVLMASDLCVCKRYSRCFVQETSPIASPAAIDHAGGEGQTGGEGQIGGERLIKNNKDILDYALVI
jgi:hypothetical protein